uniref:CCHC-type domain-containing protein n=1 Tax=Trichogramma kaykai TaxID=54128 RepID=A0ABD2W2T1_9HYME
MAVEDAVEQLPLDEQRLLRALESKVVGKVKRMAGRLAGYRRVTELLRDLRDRSVNRQVADKRALDLGNTKQVVDVDARQFGSDIRSLYEDAIAAYSQAPDINAIEREAAIYSLQNSVMDCFLLNLREPLQLLVRLKNPECLADAIDIVGDIENKLRYRTVIGSNVTSVGLIGVPTHPGTTKDSESERTTDDKNGKCQLCKKTGHEAPNCFKYKRAKLKCSNCGLKGHEDDRNYQDSLRDNRGLRRDERSPRRDASVESIRGIIMIEMMTHAVMMIGTGSRVVRVRITEIQIIIIIETRSNRRVIETSGF